jgi:hypothetical protein
MNLDGKALRIVVLGDGSAFGATGRTLTAGAREEHGLVLENLSEASSSVPSAGICICIADYLGCASRA